MKAILFFDAIINFLLGVALLMFSPKVVELLGIPESSTSFYPNILGAIFIGITIALLCSAFGSKPRRATGLGLIGAVSINLCGGAALGLWLIFGKLDLPAKGFVILWALVAILIALSLFELVRFGRSFIRRPRPTRRADEVPK